MDETRASFRTKITSTLICSVVFILSYNFTAWHASTCVNPPSFVFNFEQYISFLPWTIIPYFTSGLFFVSIFFFCVTKTQIDTLFKRLLFVIVVAGFFHFLLPLKFSLSKPDTDTALLQFLFKFLQNVDSPYNQAPSLHIAFAFVFWTVLRNVKQWRYVFAICLLSLGLSTLTTYQHHFIDVLAGAILAQLSFIIFPSEQNNYFSRNTHIANYYVLFGWVTILISLLLNEFCNSFYLMLLWPSFMMNMIAYHYQNNHVHFLKNASGNINFCKKIFYFPYVSIYLIFWQFFRKHKTAIEIMPKLYISSRLDNLEIGNLNFNQNTLVYDLSAELEEHSIIKQKARYFSVPLLDISSFDADYVRGMVLEISANYKQLPSEGMILIHCTMGLTRSSFIAILVMREILSLPIEDIIVNIKKSHKHAVIHTHLQESIKEYIYE